LNSQAKYDVAIIGGGLAGLTLSVQLARQGNTVILFEKEKYPYHKVCGEYISLESWDFLEDLGLPLSDMNLPIVRQLEVSAPGGKMLRQKLPMGGFGISRYCIDNELAKIAREAGVIILEETKVSDIQFSDNLFQIAVGGTLYEARIACASYGKRSNLDIKWKRSFAEQKNNKLNNFIGVKYHIQYDHTEDTIALHNFHDGYCGMSRVEGGKSCLCYLTTAENLRKSGNNIRQMEETILYKNPHLQKIFREAKNLYQAPLAISQISFDKKTQVENHVLMIGDAAGMITPLCGNGMSMAMHGSKIAAGLIREYFRRHISREGLEEAYITAWNQQFARRLKTGRIIQRMFGKEWLTNAFISMVKPFPGFVSFLVKQTHGDPF
jgi:menaquinone-9 beta-reductase